MKSKLNLWQVEERRSWKFEQKFMKLKIGTQKNAIKLKISSLKRSFEAINLSPEQPNRKREYMHSQHQGLGWGHHYWPTCRKSGDLHITRWPLARTTRPKLTQAEPDTLTVLMSVKGTGSWWKTFHRRKHASRWFHWPFSPSVRKNGGDSL